MVQEFRSLEKFFPIGRSEVRSAMGDGFFLQVPQIPGLEQNIKCGGELLLKSVHGVPGASITARRPFVGLRCKSSDEVFELVLDRSVDRVMLNSFLGVMVGDLSVKNTEQQNRIIDFFVAVSECEGLDQRRL